MNLLELPFVAKELIFSSLTLKDLLLIRIVSKACNNAVLESPVFKRRIKNKVVVLDWIEDVTRFTSEVEAVHFSAFSIGELSQASESELFCNKHASKIEILRVDLFKIETHNAQDCFLEKLVSLKELYIFTIGGVAEDSECLHQCLKRLKTFSFYQCYHPSGLTKLLPSLKNVTSLGLGKMHLTSLDRSKERGQELIDLLRNRSACLTQSRSSKRLGIYFDIFSKPETYFWPLSKLEEFVKEVAIQKGRIQLFNLDSYFLDGFSEFVNISREEKELFSCSMKSLINISKECCSFNMKSVERLLIKTNFKYRVDIKGFREHRHRRKPNWENLKEIVMNLNILIKNTSNVEEGDNQQARIEEEYEDIREVLDFVFMEPHPKVTTIATIWEDGELNTSLLTPNHFTINFPNLRNLRLDCKGFGTEDLAQLVAQLALHNKQLTELKLIIYGNLTDEVFFGPDKDDPNLLKLKNLKIMRFVIREPGMNDLTDSFLKDILALMPLRIFTLQNNEQPFQIKVPFTNSGLKSLLADRFGSTIQKLFIGPIGRNSRIRRILEVLQKRGEENSRKSFKRASDEESPITYHDWAFFGAHNTFLNAIFNPTFDIFADNYFGFMM